jgi:RimJ/RimL family protein N-acetyltransferase
MKEQIIGKRVILRELQEDDAEFFTYWYNKLKVMFQCGFHESTTLEEQLEHIRNSKSDTRWYAITDLSGKLIGETGLLRMWHHWHCTDMSIIIPDPAEQNKGYGGEVADLMLNRAFNLHNMNRVAIGVVGLNTVAMNFWQKVGFITEGVQEQGYFYDGVFSDFVMMRILKKKWIDKDGEKKKKKN